MRNNKHRSMGSDERQLPELGLSIPNEEKLSDTPLLNLPRELRLRIYELVFNDTMMKVVLTSHNANPEQRVCDFVARNLCLSLLLTCRSIHVEAKPILDRTARLLLVDINNLAGWATMKSRCSTDLVQNLTFLATNSFPFYEPYRVNFKPFPNLRVLTLVVQYQQFLDLGDVEVQNSEAVMDWLCGKHDADLVRQYIPDERRGRYCHYCQISNATPVICLHQLNRLSPSNRTFTLRKRLSFRINLRLIPTTSGNVRTIQRRGWIVYDEDSGQVIDTPWTQCKKSKGWPRRVREECVRLNRECEAFFEDPAKMFEHHLESFPNHTIFPPEATISRGHRWTTGMWRNLP